MGFYIITAVLFISTLYFTGPRYSDSAAVQAEQKIEKTIVHEPTDGSVFDEDSGVEIVYAPPTKDILPEGWTESPLNGKWSKLKKNDIERSIRVIKKALSKYPASVLKASLKKVYVVDLLGFYGVEYGGTYEGDVLYLSNRGIDMGYTDEFLEGSFHHEFSSVLMTNYAEHLDREKWEAVNPAGFIYSDEELGGAGAIKSGNSSLDMDNALNKKGFINEYSTSTMENDFNEFASNLFLSDPNFWERADKYPPMNEKMRMIVAFYNHVDPSFTEEFFRKN